MTLCGSITATLRAEKAEDSEPSGGQLWFGRFRGGELGTGTGSLSRDEMTESPSSEVAVFSRGMDFCRLPVVPTRRCMEADSRTAAPLKSKGKGPPHIYGTC